jgi:hypothetical protein
MNRFLLIKMMELPDLNLLLQFLTWKMMMTRWKTRRCRRSSTKSFGYDCLHNLQWYAMYITLNYLKFTENFAIIPYLIPIHILLLSLTIHWPIWHSTSNYWLNWQQECLTFKVEQESKLGGWHVLFYSPLARNLL